VLPVLTFPDDRAGLLANRIQRDSEHLNLKFWGGVYERAERWHDTHAEVYFYGLDEHDVPGERETRDRRLWTGGGRFFRSAGPKRWDVDVEAAWQGGRAHASTAPGDVDVLDVSAGLLHASAGYTWARRLSPKLGLEYDYGSGDNDPSDRVWNRFDSLFGNRRVDLGPTNIYGALGRENIQTIGFRASVAPTARFDVFAVGRWVGLAAAADSFSSTGVRDPSGMSGKDGARQLDIRLRAWIVPRVLRVETGATYLIEGPFLRAAPNASRLGNTTFSYADVTYTVGVR
jgi:hypothetical protein